MSIFSKSEKFVEYFEDDPEDKIVEPEIPKDRYEINTWWDIRWSVEILKDGALLRIPASWSVKEPPSIGLSDFGQFYGDGITREQVVERAEAYLVERVERERETDRLRELGAKETKTVWL